ncbi:MAG: hypothetical protein ABWK00_00830, partial [Desulfurococcaceae archaeon]
MWPNAMAAPHSDSPFDEFEENRSLTLRDIVNLFERPNIRLLSFILRKKGHAQAIDRLARVGFVGNLSSIARRLNMSPAGLLKLIKRFQDMGLEFMPDIDLGKLGLEELIIYVPQFIDYESVFPKDWLKSFFPLSSP